MLGAGAVLLAAGCGGTPWSKAAGDGAGGPQEARLLAAITHTTDAKTARIAMSLDLRGFGSATTVSINGGGVVDLHNQTADLNIKFGGQAPGSGEIRVVGGNVYTQLKGVWKRYSASEAAQRGTTDPMDYVSYLRGLSNDVREIGPEKVRGVATTKYSATVSLQRALDRSSASAALRARAQRALDVIGDVSMPASAWIDAAGRLRRLSIVLDMRHALEQGGVTLPAGMHPSISAVIELYDFGVPVHVQAPPGFAAVGGATTAAQDRAVQSDLRNALTAEKVVYTDNQAYGRSAATMKTVEASLDWGAKLKVVVGDALSPGDKGVVCVSETSKSGRTFSLGDVSAGPRAGTYYGKVACPLAPTAINVASLGSRW